MSDFKAGTIFGIVIGFVLCVLLIVDAPCEKK